MLAACGTTTTVTVAEPPSPPATAACSHLAIPRVLSQYVGIVEGDALPAFALDRSRACRLAVATLLLTVPACNGGTAAQEAALDGVRARLESALNGGAAPDIAWEAVRTDVEQLAAAKVCS